MTTANATVYLIHYVLMPKLSSRSFGSHHRAAPSAVGVLQSVAASLPNDRVQFECRLIVDGRVEKTATARRDRALGG